MKSARTLVPTLALTLLAALPAGAGPAPVSPRLEAALAAAAPGERQVAWVYLRDKDAADREAEGRVSARALARRLVRGQWSARQAFEDLPVSPAYVAAVARLGRVRQVSRWLNAVSVEADPRGLQALQALPFVERLDLVTRSRARRPEPELPLAAVPAARARAADVGAIDYGLSFGQLQQIQVPALHAQGLDGRGVVVAVLDSGFDNPAHEAFASIEVLATRDFVNGDEDVTDGADRGEGSHGTNTLSVLGGWSPGILVGPAYRASFLLAKTEDTESETPAEEDNWVAAAEWAEALGADVISSSLSYLTYDAPFPSLTWADMDGRTAVSTRAAELAAERGVVVVVSAGNEGPNPEHNTLGAPADGVRVLTVGAVDALGLRTSFSSVGPTSDLRIKPDVAAQGQGVVAASAYGVATYARVSGTSFSCPLTAGVAALLLQARPGYTVDQVLAVLRSTASQAGSPDNLLGWGIVNAAAAAAAPAP